jgi:hypothetical protein
MDREQFISALQSLVNSKSAMPGQAPLVIPQDLIDSIYEAPTFTDAVNQAIAVLTGPNSPVSIGDIKSLAGLSTEPQLIDPKYDETIAQDLPNFIGVPRNYAVDGVSIYDTDNEGNFLFYKDGSEYSLLANEPPEIIAAVQAELVNGGLLSVGEFIPGRWSTDEKSPEVIAFKKVLGRANATGNPDFTVALRWYVDNQESVDAFGAEPAYLPPDYATASQQVKNLFKTNLKRDPKPYELEMLANQLLSDSKKAFLASQPATLDVGDITGEELLTGDLGNHITEPEVEADTKIDPTARLYETFDRITKPEQERIQTSADIQTVNGIIIDAVTGLNR